MSYIPTTGVVRTDYIRTQFTDTDKAGEEFDRWLETVINKAQIAEGERIIRLLKEKNDYLYEVEVDYIVGLIRGEE
jgi:hypothetical protein